jgi:ribonuclease BN (tRNA processing enzyme)
MNIHVLGAHNCETRESLFVSVLVDEVLVMDAGGLTGSVSFPGQQKLKAILLTHQHYDHIRDVPAIAMNLYLQGTTINIYSTQTVYDALAAHLLNDELYPKFLELPEKEPTIRFTVMEPYQPEQIEGYNVLPVPVNHSDPTMGYQITSSNGKALFYTGDTGPGLARCWEQVSPQLLITEVTAPNRYEEFAIDSGHLTPRLLSQELISFRELKGYLPEVIAVHMNPRLEREIAAEVAEVSKALNTSISLAYEGMYLHL